MRSKRNSGDIVIILIVIETILILILIIMIVVIIAHGYLMRWKLAVVIVVEFDELSPQDRLGGWALPTITNIINHHHQHHHYHHHNRDYHWVLWATKIVVVVTKLCIWCKIRDAENVHHMFGRAWQGEVPRVSLLRLGLLGCLPSFLHEVTTNKVLCAQFANLLTMNVWTIKIFQTKYLFVAEIWKY